MQRAVETPAKKYRRYPWVEWFALGEFVLVRGEDYGCRTDSMDQIVRAKAKSLGIKVALRPSDDGGSIHVKVKEQL